MDQTRRIQFIILHFMLIGCALNVAGEKHVEKRNTQSSCSSKETCGECIQTTNCAWCMMDDFDDTNFTRCFHPNDMPPDTCRNFTWNPTHGTQIVTDHALTQNEKKGSSKSSSKPTVQIRPQNVTLQLRINEPYRLHFQYSQADDYPVDLYYLMDLSKSMKIHKEKLSSMAFNLTEAMRNITSNFKLGFGSFVDKVLFPYTSTHPTYLKEPCEGCEPPYGYRHRLSLTSDANKFKEEVFNAKISGNLDGPEGSLDAILQAIVCQNKIGWRDQARRLLVLSSDEGFHYAGDGKLGGLIEPNDGECHLDENGLYNYSTLQDYPSITQINYYAQKHLVNIIFVVQEKNIRVYKQLSDIVEGSSSALLLNDSSNVVELLRDEYDKIRSSIEIKANASKYVHIEYYSTCLNKSLPEEKTSKCNGTKIGQVIDFYAKITVTGCPPNPSEWLETIKIYPIGISEALTVNLQMLCSCPCESEGNTFFKAKSPKCNRKGNYMCGICGCDEEHFGRTCECSMSNKNQYTNDTSACKAKNDATDIECSGQGRCLCGVCECEKRENPEEQYSGRFCECDNFSCDRHNQFLCSGPDHGTCNCGKCICKPGWTGSACDCLSSDETCRPNNRGQICSGHGECECGVCKCLATAEGRYSGKYCDKCPTCATRCQELKDCVRCNVSKTETHKDQANACDANCTDLYSNIYKVDKIQDNEENDYTFVCTYHDDDDCRFKFKYTEIDGKIDVYALKERVCPPKVFMLGFVLALISAIVLVGLATLLLWKLLTTIHDRREFARFEKDRLNANFEGGNNPLYKQATTVINNPTYTEN